VSLFSKLLRVVCWLALGIYLAAALAFLGVRYWLLPNIDTWRPLIVQQISTRLGVRLDVAHIALDWHRADPVFVLDAVQLRDAHGTRVLHLPRVAGRLSWRGLWRGELWFQELELDRLELALHRDEAQRISVLNQTFAVQDALEAVASDATANAQANTDTQTDTFSLNHPALQWLSGVARRCADLDRRQPQGDEQEADGRPAGAVAQTRDAGVAARWDAAPAVPEVPIGADGPAG